LKRSPVVRIITGVSPLYQDSERESLMALLQPSQQTPLFGIANVARRTRLYATYLRLAALRPEWHDRSGLMPGELSARPGIAAAIRIPNQGTALLPDYAARPTNPPTPRNLAPIAGLETWLRRHMGDSQLARRALLNYFPDSATASTIATEVTTGVMLQDEIS